MTQSLQRHSFWLHLIALLLLYVVVVVFRASLGLSSPFYLPDDLNPFYPAEAAIQYRWASQVAAGEGLPAINVRAQHPEGLRLWTDITPVLELTAGHVYRLVGKFPGAVNFPAFSIWFIAAVSSLPIVVAWGLGTIVGRFRLAGWVAALLLAVQPLGLERVVRNFGRENLALVFVFLPLLGLALAWRALRELQGGRWNFTVLAGVFIAVGGQVLAFASWHLSRTFFEITVALLVLLAVVRQLSAEERRVVVLWLLLLLPAYVLVPALRVRGFIVSPGVVLGHLFVLNELLQGHIRKTWVRLPLILLTAAGAVAWLRPQERDTHVLAVVGAKIRFLLTKPSDPTLLSPEARMMWIEAFHSPELVRILTFVLPVLILVATGAALGWNGVQRIWKESAGMRLLVVQTAAWGAGFTLIYRMHVVFLFNLSVLAGVLVAQAGGRWRRTTLLTLSALIVLFYGWQSVTFSGGNSWMELMRAWRSPQQAEPFVNLQRDTVSLLDWIRKETEPDAVFAGWFGVSSLVYAYADRPVVVQSKFENPTVRTKVEQLAAALYGSENALAEFCRRYDVSYVVYEVPFLLSASTESVRYVAGHQTVNPDMAVYQMHFQPYELENFELVYQNGGFRVFEFLKSPQQQYRNLPVGWEAIYERAFYGLDPESPYDDRKSTSAVTAVRQMDFARLATEVMAGEGRYPEAKRILEQLLAKEPRFWQGWLTLARAAREAGDWATVRRAASGVLKGHPGHEEARQLLEAGKKPVSESRRR